MKSLIRIWKLQFVRNDKREELVPMFIVFFIFPIVFISSAYFILYDRIQETVKDIDLSPMVVIFAFVFQISDFFFKLMFEHSGSDMSDYLKSRPVSTATWCRFIVFDNAFVEANWRFIPTIATCLFLLLDLPSALLSSLLFIAISQTNGLALQTLFYSHNFESKAVTFCAGFLFFPITSLITGISFGVNRWLPFVVYIALCAVMQYSLYRCLRILRNYPDYSRTTSKSHSFFVRKSTLPVWVALRSTTLRYGLVMSQIMALTWFLMYFMGPTHQLEPGSVLVIIMLSSCGIRAIMFGAEANYMDGLWSRPGSIKKMLRHNFLFYTSICVIDAVLMCLAVCQNGISQVILVLASTLYSIGILNNIELIGVFGSLRLDLFQRSLMKRNGGQSNFKVALWVAGITFGMMAFAIYATTEIFCWVTGGLGIIGILLNPHITDWVAKRYVANRYTHFERYRN